MQIDNKLGIETTRLLPLALIRPFECLLTLTPQINKLHKSCSPKIAIALLYITITAIYDQKTLVGFEREAL